jgi:hypothetical protein
MMIMIRVIEEYTKFRIKTKTKNKNKNVRCFPNDGEKS